MKAFLLAIALVFPGPGAGAAVAEPGLKTVVIDPGHGGKDPGCVSRDGKTYEKNIALDISLRLGKMIRDSLPDVKVLNTRGDDRFIPLINRARFATSNDAGLFISVHINAQEKGTNANGYSIHLLGESRDKTKDTYAFNMDVCRRENSVILLEDDYKTTYKGFWGDNPQSAIFLNLMHTAYREQSLLFADKVNESLSSTGVFRRSNGVTQDNFAVLRLATMPAVLLELGFITNPEDLAALRDTSNTKRIAEAIFKAFRSYKELYDASVSVRKQQEEENPAPAATTTPPVQAAPATAPADTVRKEPAPTGEGKPAASAAEAPAPADTAKAAAPVFGTQIFASSRLLPAFDPAFLGYEVRIVEGGGINRYVIGLSENLKTAKEMHKKISGSYGDSFMVSIDAEGKLSRVR